MYENIKTVEAGGISSAAAGFLKGVLFAAVFTVAVFLIAALILSYTPMSEGTIPYISFVTEFIGAAVAAFVPAKKAGRNGAFTGVICGFLYILFIWLVASLCADGFYIGKHILIMLGLSLIAGAIGGILGVNLKSTTNKKKR